MAGEMRDIHEGMHVVDAEGEKAGTVKELRMGDPNAASAEGQPVPGAGGFADLLGAGPDLPPEQAERLLRIGYIKVEGKLLRRDFYAAADEIDRVEDDTVYLRARSAT